MSLSFLSVLYEVIIQRQKVYMIVTYQYPSQTAVEFDKVLSNFEKLLNFAMLARWHNITWRHWQWFINNSGWTAATNIRANHLLPNSLSCTDLTFPDQPNLTVDRGSYFLAS